MSHFSQGISDMCHIFIINYRKITSIPHIENRDPITLGLLVTIPFVTIMNNPLVTFHMVIVSKTSKNTIFRTNLNLLTNRVVKSKLVREKNA